MFFEVPGFVFSGQLPTHAHRVGHVKETHIMKKLLKVNSGTTSMGNLAKAISKKKTKGHPVG